MSRLTTGLASITGRYGLSVIMIRHVSRLSTGLASIPGCAQTLQIIRRNKSRPSTGPASIPGYRRLAHATYWLVETLNWSRKYFRWSGPGLSIPSLPGQDSQLVPQVFREGRGNGIGRCVSPLGTLNWSRKYFRYCNSSTCRRDFQLVSQVF